MSQKTILLCGAFILVAAAAFWFGTLYPSLHRTIEMRQAHVPEVTTVGGKIQEIWERSIIVDVGGGKTVNVPYTASTTVQLPPTQASVANLKVGDSIFVAGHNEGGGFIANVINLIPPPPPQSTTNEQQ